MFNNKPIILFLFFVFYVGFIKAQFVPDGYYGNENKDIYARVKNDTLLYCYCPGEFNPSGINFFKISKNTIYPINPKLVFDSNSLIDSTLSNYCSKSFFKLFDFLGRELDGMLYGYLYFENEHKQRQDTLVTFEKKDGYYTYDFNVLPKGVMGLREIKMPHLRQDPFYSNSFYCGFFLNPKEASYSKVFLSPSIAYFSNSIKYTKKNKHKYKLKNGEIKVLFPKKGVIYSPGPKVFLKKVDPATWNPFIHMIFDYLAGIRQPESNSFKVVPLKLEN